MVEGAWFCASFHVSSLTLSCSVEFHMGGERGRDGRGREVGAKWCKCNGSSSLLTWRAIILCARPFQLAAVPSRIYIGVAWHDVMWRGKY